MLQQLQRIDAPKAKAILITVFCAFAGFALVIGAFGRLTDPRAPFDAIAHTHTEITLLFQIINIAFDLACLAVLVGGLPILFDIVRYALVNRQRANLFLLGAPLALLLLAIGENTLVFTYLVPGGNTAANATPQNLVLVISAFVLLLLAGIVCIIGPALAILRSPINERFLRFALALAGIVVLAMAVTLFATILWGLRILADAPQLYSNGAIALFPPSGGADLIVIVVLMVLATGIPIAALIRSLPGQVRAA